MLGHLSCASGFGGHFEGANNGRIGLDWITDELMTVKRARRLYISLIISAWRMEQRRAGELVAVG